MSASAIPTRLEAAMEIAHRAADAARAPCLAHFRAEGLTADNKDGAGYDPVTAADREAEAAIRALGDFKPLFAEAAHVLRGLVRADGALPAQYLVELLRPALRGFDAMDDDTVALADDMLEVARRRRDVLSEAQVQLLEEANDHAEQLAHLLHSAMQEHEAQLDTQFNEMQLDALEADACLETVPPLSSDETGLT